MLNCFKMTLQAIKQRWNEVIFFLIISLMLLTGNPVIFAQNQKPPVFQPEPVASPFQSWADENKNKLLEAPEQERLLAAVRELFQGPHPVNTPVDEFFDFNRDRRLDNQEITNAGEILLGKQLLRLEEFKKPQVARLLDINRNGRVDEAETKAVQQFLLYCKECKQPHKAKEGLDLLLDYNQDKFVDEKEIQRFNIEVVRTAVLLPLESGNINNSPVNKQIQENAPVKTYLEKLADLNRNGQIDAMEKQQLRDTLSGPHPVTNPMDELIDFNQNKMIEKFEIAEAIRMGAAKETDSKETNGKALPVTTKIDEIFDLNQDKKVEQKEIEAMLFTYQQANFKIKEPNKINKFFDLDHDLFISKEEVWQIREKFLRPHPVDPKFDWDKALDTNQNRFIEPEEIGIAAGYNPAVGYFPSFEELLERMAWDKGKGENKFSTEKPVTDGAKNTQPTTDTAYTAATQQTEQADSQVNFQKRLGSIKSKKLAVTGLDTISETLSKETTSGLIVFIENAFVNIGEASVVDRKNITRIMEEHAFQQTDLVDSETAVKIGKLLGADYIVVGDVTYVGKKYYLRTKLISVETGEVFGSSIAETENESGFLDMCNNSVLTLFKY